MSIIPTIRRAAIEKLESRKYFDERRRQVDRAWSEYRLTIIEREERGDEQPDRYGFDALSKQTDAFVKREAQKWAHSCRKYRLYEDDFESNFRLTVLKAALKYNGIEGSLFDYLRTAIRNAGRDIVRNALTKKNRIDHLALRLDGKKVQREIKKNHSVRSAEYDAVNRMVIEEMTAEPTLTEQERMLFEFLRADPDATLQEMADALGVRDRKQASRIKERLANKLRKYIDE